jgi:hypothetical protein
MNFINISKKLNPLCISIIYHELALLIVMKLVQHQIHHSIENKRKKNRKQLIQITILI